MRKGFYLAVLGSLIAAWPGFFHSPCAAHPTPGFPDLGTAIADVAQNSTEAVVHIEVSQRVQAPSPVFPFESDPFFRYFFGPPQKNRPDRREIRGIGTGMIIDSQGHVLTNHHVVNGASKIRVKVASGDEFDARIVGTDPKTDLAVVRIKAPPGLPFLKFGDSDKLRVGEWVVAIGNPRGLEQTVTAGIISAKHRAGITDPSSYQDFIQTDAAINPGNSGGPLLNLAGEVVGVNAAIVSESGGFEGIGFAIPSNMAAGVARALIQSGKVIRGWLGLSLQELTPALARTMDLKAVKGAIVADVAGGGPAEKAGIRKGDVVVSLEGNAVEGPNDLRNKIAATQVGRKVDIGLVRKGERVTVQPVVEAYRVSVRPAGPEFRNKLGIEVREISIMDARKNRLPSRDGLIVSRLDPQGPGSMAGLEPGDVIREINQKPLRRVKEFHRILEQIQPGGEATLLVRDGRTGDTGYVSVVVP
ncbi:MAG TPA: Do family serine endopeptidase [Thermodesulfobacteriota bacterium]|nr:Do family serine endopeptidase [Thermodesulfobacteriota bacterium]